MVDQSPQLDLVFRALADPTRRALLAELRAGEASVSDLAAPIPMSLQAVSKHLRVLEQAGLLEREIRGRTHRLRLVGATLDEAAGWIDEQRSFWGERLDELEKQLGAGSKRRRGGLPRESGR